MQNGADIAPDTSVKFPDYEVFSYGTETEVFIDPMIFITKDSDDPVTVRTTSNYPIQLCIGGQCEAAQNITKEGLTFAANTPTSLLLDCSIIFNEGEEIILPEIDVLIEAWYTSDPANVTKMRLFMGNIAGINDVAANRNMISVNGKALNYKVNGTSTIEVFNLTGRCVSTKTVQGSGTVSLGNLSKGVYLYRVNGAMKATGKIVIK